MGLSFPYEGLSFARIKHLPQVEGQLKRAYPTSAGLDICANQNYVIPGRSSEVITTGIAISMPPSPLPDMEYHIQVWPRSGLSVKQKVETGAGICDAEYRGEYKIHLYNHGNKPVAIKAGDRVAQLVTVLCYVGPVREVETLDDTDRGEGGFGSSGV